MDNNDKEIRPYTFGELLEAQVNEHACTQTALTVGLPKFMFAIDIEGVVG